MVILQHFLHLPLRPAVWVDRVELVNLPGAHLVAIYGRRGGVDVSIYPGAEGRVHERPRAFHVVLVILHRIGRALSNLGVGSEVHHRVELVVPEQGFHHWVVIGPNSVDRDPADRPLVARGEVVQHHHAEAVLFQVRHYMAPDVPGASGYQNSHTVASLLAARSRAASSAIFFAAAFASR